MGKVVPIHLKAQEELRDAVKAHALNRKDGKNTMAALFWYALSKEVPELRDAIARYR